MHVLKAISWKRVKVSEIFLGKKLNPPSLL